MVYSKCRLTFPSDKLIALSGLAKDMYKRLQELRPRPHRYLAGLWKERLIETISWSVWWPAKRASEYRAPSWSWACLDGHVSIHQPQSTDRWFYCARLLWAETSETNGAGHLESGTIELVGPCATMEAGGPRSRSEYPLTSQGRVDSVHESCPSDCLIRDDHVHQMKPSWRHDSVTFFDTLVDVQETVLNLMVSVRFGGEERWTVLGLALLSIKKRTGGSAAHGVFQQRS